MLIEQLASSPSQQDWPSHGHVSLWTMHRFNPSLLVILTKNMATLERFIDAPPEAWNALMDTSRHHIDRTKEFGDFLITLQKSCRDADLPHTDAIIEGCKGITKPTSDVLRVIFLSLMTEMQAVTYLRIPSDRGKYWECDGLVSDAVKQVFPSSAVEIRESATAYACGLWSATVFHAMRAAEGALVSIANELGIAKTGVEEWGRLLDQIESQLRALAQRPKNDPVKSAHLATLSEITSDIRLFKDAWRNQVSHGQVAYSDGRAVEILNAVRRVLDAAAARTSGPT